MSFFLNEPGKLMLWELSPKDRKGIALKIIISENQIGILKL